MSMFAGVLDDGQGGKFGLVSIAEDLIADSGISGLAGGTVPSGHSLFSRLDNIVFDTRLNYLRIIGYMDVNLDFPATTYSTTSNTITTYNLGIIPSNILAYGTVLLVFSYPNGEPFDNFYYFSSLSARFFTIYQNTSNNTLEARVIVSHGYNGSVPAFSQTVRCSFISEV